MNIPSWVRTVSEVLHNAAQADAIRVDAHTPRKLADQLGQWFGHLSQNALIHWPATVISGKSCEFCEEEALSRCIVCGSYCCLAHSHVSHRAEAVCDECIGSLLDNSKKSLEQQSFEFFHLTKSASFEELTAVYKVRMKQQHPDAGGSEAAAKQVSRHYEVLKKHYRR